MGFDEPVDLLIIGGGINGAGIARDAAGRGLSVVLCEQGDLASATSSASSKLIHGGLRYLEHYAFKLVREALSEREILLTNAPHIVRPLRFVLPHDAGARPAWVIRAGLFLYDRLGGPLGSRRRLQSSRAVDLRSAPEGTPLREEFHRGFAYTDCAVDDSRLVVLNARCAADKGAHILTRTRWLGAIRQGESWTATLHHQASGEETTVRARTMVNAAGTWVDPVFETATGVRRSPAVQLVKGSHIVVNRRYDGDHAYILQNTDGRVVFALPFEDRFTLIGTTDAFYDGDRARVHIDDGETIYLCEAFNRFFSDALSPADVVWSFAGVRPLYGERSEDASKLSRDYTLHLDDDGAPLLSVLGGKITTYRRLAEQVMAMLAPYTPKAGGAWTATTPLPGGDLPGGDVGRFAEALHGDRPWLPVDLAGRLARSYGTRADALLGDAASMADMGKDFGASLYEREVAYLVRQEWAKTSEDILWRRGKLGLHAPDSTAFALEQWLADAGENYRMSAAL